MLPIVLIHGFPFDSGMWHYQAEHLRASGHRVLTPNLPGFGPDATAFSPEASSIDAFAEYVCGVIEKEAGGTAVVAGFSMGGYILLALLRNYPAMVSAAMFVDTRAEADSPVGRETRLKSIDQVQHEGSAKFIDTMLGKLLAPNVPAAVREEARAIMARQCVAGTISAQTAMANRRDQTDLLPDIKIPALVIVGEHDAVTPPTAAQAMRAKLPTATLIEIQAAGHLTPLENPTAVNAAMDRFLASLK